MLRVKPSFLEGKTTLKRVDGKVRPLPDQINEILTKETIPPSMLEIKQGNKWIPLSEWNKAHGKTKLKSSPLKSLEQEAKKYKTTININDKNDLEYLGRILSKDNIADIKAGKLTNFRGTPYEDLARVNLVSETPKTIAQQLEGKIKPVKLKENILYHGTSPDVVDSIFSQGFKKGSELPKNAFRSGGYDQLQNSISLTTSPKTAEIFSGTGKNVSVIKTKLADNAKIVKIEGIQDAVDLEDYISYLTKNKIDAVWIGGGEKELVVLNSKKLIPIDSITKSVYKGK